MIIRIDLLWDGQKTAEVVGTKITDTFVLALKCKT